MKSDRSRSFAGLLRAFAALILLLFVSVLVGCRAGDPAAGGKKGPGGRADMGIPVTVAHASQRDVPIQADVIGAVEASSSVVLKPQISGQVMQAHFHEGDFVKAGQLMLTIDPRALEAQLSQLQAQVLRDQAALGQSQATLARDRAMEENAKAQLGRAEQLWKSGVISKEQYDQYVATEASYVATINADLAAIENSKAQIAASKAAVDNQKVQLGYTRIYAPITGRTGTLTVKPGNVVTANTTELATINQVEPVFVTFALPEIHLGALHQSGAQRLPVTAVPEEGGNRQSGVLAFFENTVDPSTGTVRLKASFTNKDHTLWPGQFVRVTLKLGEHNNAILIPSQAVQSGQEGTFVYIVKPDQKVDIRQISTSQRLGDETVIERGVAPGETVVTEGTLRLVPGARVQVRERPAGAGGRPGLADASGPAAGGPGAPEAAVASPAAPAANPPGVQRPAGMEGKNGGGAAGRPADTGGTRPGRKS